MREKFAWTMVAALGLAVVATFAGVVRGGPLDPPSPPSPTMKTLDQVEPRTPIDSIPFAITEPGSYFLTRDLVAAGSSLHGVTIESDAVTLDLNGFSLTGTGLAGGGRAIVVLNAAHRDIVIRNGTIRGWSNAGIDGLFGGILVSSTLEDLIITNNLGEGIRIGGGNSLRRIVSGANQGDGVLIVTTGAVSGTLITDSKITNNGLVGVQSGVDRVIVRDSVVSDNGSHGFNLYGVYNEIANNVVKGNGDVGIRVGSRGVVTGNHVTENATDGILPVLLDARVGPEVADVSLTTDNPFANIVFDNPPTP